MEGREEVVDVTLGSLEGESLDALEGLGVLDGESEEGEEGQDDEEEHLRTNPGRMQEVDNSQGTTLRRTSYHSMRNRGVPYFEEMVENSRLGRIKRQKGGHTSFDGRTTVHWEVVEIEGDDGSISTVMDTSTESEAGGRNKRQKLDA